MRKGFKVTEWAIIDIHSADFEVVAVYDDKQEALWVCQEQNDYVKLLINMTDLEPRMVSAYRVVGYLNGKLIFDN